MSGPHVIWLVSHAKKSKKIITVRTHVSFLKMKFTESNVEQFYWRNWSLFLQNNWILQRKPSNLRQQVWEHTTYTHVNQLLPSSSLQTFASMSCAVLISFTTKHTFIRRQKHLILLRCLVYVSFVYMCIPPTDL